MINSPNPANMNREKLIDSLMQVAIWVCLGVALLMTLLIVTSYRAAAQWSIDPTDPMVVCDAANTQQYLRAIADADSGWYVFWSDARNNAAKADLYGQHFDSEGNALWTPNGQLLLSHPARSINLVAPLLMPDGSVIVAYVTGTSLNHGDTVRAMRFDDNATALWVEPALLLGGLDYRSLEVVASENCAYVVVYCESCGGGGYGCRQQRVGMDGTVQFTLPQQIMTAHYGPYTVHPDGSGGILHTIRAGNGAGTSLHAQRFDSTGTAVWPAYISVADAQGLSYAFTTTSDSMGAQTAVWEVAGDLRMNRIDTTGTALWSPAVLPAVDLPTFSQATPAAVVVGTELFVAWSDNRPPASNADLYMQKYDLATGAELWAADGVLAIQQNSYIPTARLVASDSGAVIGIMDFNMGSSYSAMRIRNDGTPAWADPVSFSTGPQPFYDDRVELADGSGGVVAFWETSTDDLYGARIYRNGKLYDDVGVHEAGPTATITAYPNPAHDRITLQLPGGERPLTVEIMDVTGARTMLTANGNTIAIDQLIAGAYVARIRTTNNYYTALFVKD